jgi:hypothetical protein
MPSFSPHDGARFYGSEYTRYVGSVGIIGAQRGETIARASRDAATSEHNLTGKFHSAGSDSKNDQE